jgi:putative endonuclease
MEYVVYILYSKSHDKIYIGFTSDLINRFHSHNKLGKKGWTEKYRPWEVIYCEVFEKKKDAISREENLKGAKAREWIRTKVINEYMSFGFISA